MMTVSKIEGASTLGDGGVNLQAGTKLLAVVKGAPNYIIDQCTTYLTPEGTEAPMTEAVKASTMTTIDELSSQALRVLAVAVKPMPAFPLDEADEDLSSDDKFKAIAHNIRILKDAEQAKEEGCEPDDDNIAALDC